MTGEKVLALLQRPFAVTAAETAIQAAVTEFNDPYTAFIPCTNDTAGPWLFGTGNTVSPIGDGNADLYIGSDGSHPNDAGHSYLGRMCALGIRRAARTMLANIT
jgi:hypothetical protein